MTPTPLRILVFGLNLAPDSTGIPRYTGELVEWLAARGHRVDAIAAIPHYPEWRTHESYRGKGFHEEMVGGARVFRVPVRLPRRLPPGAADRIALETSFNLGALRYASKVFSGRARYDVALAICPPLQGAVFPYLLRSLRGVPWVFHVQDFQVDAAASLGMFGGRIFGALLRRIESHLLRSATAVTTISPAMAIRAVERGAAGDRVHVVPNWADLDAIRPRAPEQGLREELGCSDPERLLVLCAGAMGEKYDFRLLLDVAETLRSDPGIHFAIVGDGSAKPRTVEDARERDLSNVSFLGVQPRERLQDLLNAADLHVVPQKEDAADLVLPSRLTNILAAGRPVVITAARETVMGRMLDEHDVGFLTPPGDAPTLAAALRSIAADRSRLEAMGRVARRYAEQHFDRDTILARFETLLEAVARRTGSGVPTIEPSVDAAAPAQHSVHRTAVETDASPERVSVGG